jgi:hypothetical protein
MSNQSPPKDFSKLTLSAIEAALMAGEILRQGFGTSFSVTAKSRHRIRS